VQAPPKTLEVAVQTQSVQNTASAEVSTELDSQATEADDQGAEVALDTQSTQTESADSPQQAPDMPRVVAYALGTSHPVGEVLYERSGFIPMDRYLQNCAQYSSPSLAQQAFLDNGGPEDDNIDLDIDGDGYACAWDPVPVRAAHAEAGN